MALFRQAFAAADKDGNGALDADELRTAFHNLGWLATEDEVADVVKRFDADGNGTTEIDEFVAMMTELKSVPAIQAALAGAATA